MTARPLPGTRWLLWMRSAALRTGFLTGVYLSIVFFAWLFIANRVPELEPLAGVRNLCAGALIVLLMTIPIFRFRDKPARLFISGLTAWTILTFTYIAAQIRFSLLESRMGAMQVFVLGALSIGLAAVFDWVLLLCMEIRHRHVHQIHDVPGNRSRTRF